ncbi:MAG TPA: class I SAM-dependent methyltransferase [Ktedonobacterales bacterium]
MKRERQAPNGEDGDLTHSANSDGEIARELDRIRDEYSARAARGASAGQYGLFDEAALAHTQSVERAVLGLLKRRGMTRLSEAVVLDVGCGSGLELRRFLDYGARPENLYGVDLLPKRIDAARAQHPGIQWSVGSAHQLPFEDERFDIVMCFTVLSSILDATARDAVAAEMRRVRKQTGVIICHDFVYSNPRNPAVRGVSVSEMRRLFHWPGAQTCSRRVTLAPPLARRVAPRMEWLASALERLQFLNTHVVTMVY